MNTTGWIVVILTIFIVISINAWLIARLRSKPPKKGFSMWKNVSERIRNPWITEDRKINQLSKMVEDLRINQRSNQQGKKGQKD